MRILVSSIQLRLFDFIPAKKEYLLLFNPFLIDTVNRLFKNHHVPQILALFRHFEVLKLGVSNVRVKQIKIFNCRCGHHIVFHAKEHKEIIVDNDARVVHPGLVQARSVYVPAFHILRLLIEIEFHVCYTRSCICCLSSTGE